MKNIALLCLSLALFFPGCCKKSKKSKKQSKKPKVQASLDSRNFPEEYMTDEQEIAYESPINEDQGFEEDEVMLGEAQQDEYAFDFENKDQDAEQTFVENENMEPDSDEDNDEDDEDEHPKETFASIDLEDDRYQFERINFNFNESTISKEQEGILARNAEKAKQAVAEGKKIIIEGHTCQMGPESTNQRISKDRADTIKKLLVEKGVDEKNISTVGYGDELALVWSDADNRDEKIDDLSVNRRVEITVE